MKRNWYAVLLLGILAATLLVAGIYICYSTQNLQDSLQTAYGYAELGEYSRSRLAFEEVTRQAETTSKIWYLLIRRSLVDQLNQTLATIPSYVSEENIADLAVETSRACAQVEQIKQSFFSWL